MATIDLTNREWKVKTYGTPLASCEIDIMRPLFQSEEKLRWTYTVITEVYPERNSEGVDGDGNRASGYAHPAIISDPPQKNIKYTLVEIGDTISTPFGNYRVEWSRPNSIDRDNLSLVEIKD